MKLLAGIIIGIIITFAVSKAYAGYSYTRLYEVDSLDFDRQKIILVWDDLEKTNCYIVVSRFMSDPGGISCVRSMHYKE